MKRRLQHLIIFLNIITGTLLAQTIQWVTTAGGPGDDGGYKMLMDKSDNTYLTGRFRENATFGNFNLVSNNSEADIFVAKFNPSGKVDWVLSCGGAHNSVVGIGLDNSGNIYISGFFEGNIHFGDISIQSIGDRDAFVAKLNSSGAWQWAISGGGQLGDYAWTSVTDTIGNTYVAGTFRGSATFGQVTLSCAGEYDLFVAKCNSSGIWEWAQRAGGSVGEWPLSCGIDVTGNIYIAGYWESAGNTQFGDFQLVSSGAAMNMFIAKCKPTGEWEWAKQAESSGMNALESMVVDNYGNSYVLVNFQENLTFGGKALIPKRGAKAYSDKFLAKLNATGELDWVRQIYSNDNSFYINGLSLDANGNTYIYGKFRFNITFDNTMFENNGGNYIPFWTKFNSLGNFQWLKKFNAQKPNSGIEIYAVCANNSNDIYLGGYFYGNCVLGDKTLSTAGRNDIFLMKVSTDEASGINLNVESDNLVEVFPNPSLNNEINVLFESNGIENTIIKLIDSNGKMVYIDYQSHVGVNHLKINMDDYRPGIYFLQITTAEQNYNRKIIYTPN